MNIILCALYNLLVIKPIKQIIKGITIVFRSDTFDICRSCLYFLVIYVWGFIFIPFMKIIYAIYFYKKSKKENSMEEWNYFKPITIIFAISDIISIIITSLEINYYFTYVNKEKTDLVTYIMNYIGLYSLMCVVVTFLSLMCFSLFDYLVKKYKDCYNECLKKAED